MGDVRRQRPSSWSSSARAYPSQIQMMKREPETLASAPLTQIGSSPQWSTVDLKGLPKKTLFRRADPGTGASSPALRSLRGDLVI